MEAVEAARLIRAGATVRMTTGDLPDDPILLVKLEDGAVVSESVGGWSAGVREPVCAADSDFLTTTFLRGRLELVAVPVPVGILERAGRLVDDLADRQRHDDPDADPGDYLRGASPDDHDTFARALYAAARGEKVDWSAC